MNDNDLLKLILNKILKEEVMTEFVNKIEIDGSSEDITATISQTIMEGPSFARGQVQTIKFDPTDENIKEAMEEIATAQVKYYAKESVSGR